MNSSTSFSICPKSGSPASVIGVTIAGHIPLKRALIDRFPILLLGLTKVIEPSYPNGTRDRTGAETFVPIAWQRDRRTHLLRHGSCYIESAFCEGETKHD